jgi:hypothetical protein
VNISEVKPGGPRRERWPRIHTLALWESETATTDFHGADADSRVIHLQTEIPHFVSDNQIAKRPATLISTVGLRTQA